MSNKDKGPGAGEVVPTVADELGLTRHTASGRLVQGCPVLRASSSRTRSCSFRAH